MDQDQQRRLQSWAATNWKLGEKCPVCQAELGFTAGDVVQVFPFAGGALALGGPIYPLVPLACNNCGYTLLINAVVAGVLPSAPQSESSPAPVADAPAEQPGRPAGAQQ